MTPDSFRPSLVPNPAPVRNQIESLAYDKRFGQPDPDEYLN